MHLPNVTNPSFHIAPLVSMTTPVLMIIFNRPGPAKKVFEAIREARPKRLYIAADGPRQNKPGEAENCEAARKVVSNVDWDCEVHTLFRTENLGCGKGPSTAISWFFEFETEGIILEDDCLPSPTFFPFCTELLERYRYDKRVMQIGGNNFEKPRDRDDEYSYRFSKHVSIWGWATWRRAWKLHDFNMGHYKEIRDKQYLNDSYSSIYERDLYQYVFQKMYRGDNKISSKTIWDYQWQFACKINSGLIIIPNRNLVHNLGFGDDATNTRNPNGTGHNLPMEAVLFPLRHPEFMMVEESRDDEVFRKVSTSPSSRMKSRLKNLLPNPVVKIIKPLMRMFF